MSPDIRPVRLPFTRRTSRSFCVGHLTVFSGEPQRKGGKAFSLIELLAVMAVLGFLVSATLPAFNSITDSRGITKGIYDTEGLLELARNEAISRQTYVWVAFQNMNTPTGSEIRMAAVASLDGSGTNTNSSNLIPFTRIIHIRDAQLIHWSDLKAATKNLLTGSIPESVVDNTEGTAFTVGNTSFNTGNSITFTPRGEALLKGAASATDGYDNLIDVSFRKAHGSVVTANADDAAVIVQGSTGMAHTLRLQ
ncbi:MAG: Tfp pilus assembly protein FimT/FimU [Chthoniobacteraceae bacterium]